MVSLVCELDVCSDHVAEKWVTCVECTPPPVCVLHLLMEKLSKDVNVIYLVTRCPEMHNKFSGSLDYVHYDDSPDT